MAGIGEAVGLQGPDGQREYALHLKHIHPSLWFSLSFRPICPFIFDLW